VEQTMVSSCSARSKIKTLYKKRFKTTHGAIARRTGTGSSAANHNHIIFFFF
jgi:hypothetical protein